MAEQDATVDVRDEFTVVTPGGGFMAENHHTGKLAPAQYPEQAVIYNLEGKATLAAQKLNEALRDIGIDDRAYLVAKRTVTTVTTAWNDGV